MDVTVLMHLVASSAALLSSVCRRCRVICLNLPSTLYMKGKQSLKSSEGTF